MLWVLRNFSYLIYVAKQVSCFGGVAYPDELSLFYRATIEKNHVKFV